MLNPEESALTRFDNSHLPLRPTYIEPKHWEEWRLSGVAPELIRNNVKSLSRTREKNQTV